MLRTCAKCGTQFYGIDCPECDYPPRPADAGQKKRDRIWGLLFMGLGVWVGVAASIGPHALPSWPAFIAGVVFFSSGFGIAMGVKGRRASALGGVICAGMAGLGFFAAFGPGEVEGGIPLLPAAWNQGFGRIAFGGGACLTAAFALWLLYRAVKPCKNK